MNIKKAILLVSMALAAIALAVPAVASAGQYTWTDDHVHLGDGEKAVSHFEGFLLFETPAPPLPTSTTFGCEIPVEIEAEGPDHGRVLEFDPTTTTCVGTGVLKDCHLIHDTSNIAEGWTVEVVGTHLVVKHSDPTKNITIHNEYTGCASPYNQTTSHLQFASITMTPDLNGEGTIEHLTVNGTATNGVTKITGSLTPAASMTLGLTAGA